MDKFVMTNSMRNQSVCVSKLQSLYLYKLKPRWYQANRALVIGSATHEGVEFMYRAPAESLLEGDLPLQEGLKAALGYFDGAIKQYQAYNKLHKKQSEADFLYDTTYDRMLVSSMIKVYYHEIYLKEEFNVAVVDGDLGLEQTMMANTITPDKPLTDADGNPVLDEHGNQVYRAGRKSSKYLYAGKNDQLFWNPVTALHYLSELKTKASGFWNAASLSQLERDDQITGYLWLFRMKSKSKIKVNNIIYTVLLKPKAPVFRKRMAETDAEFKQRILDERYGKMGEIEAKMLANMGDYWDRKHIHRSDAVIEAFGPKAYHEAVRIEKMLHGPRYNTPGTDNCTKFGKRCEFFDLCGESTMPKDLSVDFIIKSNAHEELGLEVES